MESKSASRQSRRLEVCAVALLWAVSQSSGCRCGDDEEEVGYTVVPVEEQTTVDNTQNLNAARETEAGMYLQRIAQSARVYYMSDRVSPNGNLLPRQFPGPVSETPLEIPCGASVNTSSADWSDPVWQALEFAVYESQYFSYSFTSFGEGDNARFTATARGDLNCDGVPTAFSINGWLTDDRRIRLSGVYEERQY